jgi:uncharacterized protein YegJ (DUF2314 family)
MSDSEPSKVFLFEGDDPQMKRASEQARSTFRYFWRELSWEYRRIVPGLDLAAVKSCFRDPGPEKEGEPSAEHMWFNEIDFDGKIVSGVLLNQPNWLTSVKQGDRVRIPLAQIDDWMYSMFGEVYGAYTVNLMRSRMGARERRDHDQAWGLSFGDPSTIRIVPAAKKPGFLARLFSKPVPPDLTEHPMSENMAPSLRQQLSQSPAMLQSKDDKGWTFLHQLALAGSTACVKVLLEHGADKNVKTPQGQTPLDLARVFNWEPVIALLSR